MEDQAEILRALITESAAEYDLRAKICAVRSQVDDLAQEARDLWEATQDPDQEDILIVLKESLENISADLADLENDPDEFDTNGIECDGISRD